MNKFLDKLYTIAEQSRPPENIMSFAKDLMIGADEHQWGKSPFHFILNYYQEATADFELRLIRSPSLKGFQKLPINNNALDKYTTKIYIENRDKDIIFSIKPKFKNVKVAFYLYKDKEKIDSQWYSTNFTYKLDKKKHGAGKYRVGYFIVDEKEKAPGKAKKSESGFSEYVIVQ